MTRKPKLDATTKRSLEAGQRSLGFFMGLVHRTDMSEVFGGAALPAAHHKEIVDALMWEEMGHTVIIAPRGSAKTSLVQGYVEWRLGRASLGLDGYGENWANDFRVIVASNTARQAYKISNAVKATIEGNENYRAMFPKVLPHKDKWAEPEWKVQGNVGLHATMVAVGVGGPLLGSRGDRIVLDDIADEENMHTMNERGKAISWLEKTLMPCLVPGGRIIMAATRWHEDDPAAWAMDQGWRHMIMKALVPCDGEGCKLPGDHDLGWHSFWPGRFSVEELLKQKKQRPRAFALQMQNEIVPEEGVMFHRAWFRNRYDYVPSPEDIRMIAASWDTAGTETGRSYTVGLVDLVTKDWDHYLLALYREKLNYPDIKRLIRDVAKRWRVDWTFIEAKSTGQPALQELSQDEGMRGRLFPIQPRGQRGGPQSLDYADQISVICEAKRVWLPSQEFLQRSQADDWPSVFLGEVLGFPDAANDDVVMALTQMLYELERWKGRWEHEELWRELGPVRYVTSGRERRVLV